MEYDGRVVANYLIERARDEGRDVTPLHVNKLVYFCHAWMLAIHHRPLLKEPVEAWPRGPVVPDVYDSLRRFGGEPINRLIPAPDEDFDSDAQRIIDEVWEKYGKLRDTQLSGMSHARGTPWHETWQKRKRYAVIPDPVLERYYAARLETVQQHG